jgi:hypothetical protein
MTTTPVPTIALPPEAAAALQAAFGAVPFETEPATYLKVAAEEAP